MAGKSYHRIPVILLNAAILVVCAIGMFHVVHKAGIAVDLEETERKVTIRGIRLADTGEGLTMGERILSIDGIPVSTVEDVEFALDAHRIGDLVPFRIAGASGVRNESITLVSYYGLPYLVIMISVSLLFYVLGLVVYVKSPGDKAARLFHAGTISTALMLSTTWGCYGVEPARLGLLLRPVFSFAYVFTPTLFFHFTAVFPRQRWLRGERRLHILYGVAGILGFFTSFTFVRAAVHGSVVEFHDYLNWFVASRWYLMVVVAAGLATITQSYRTAGDEPDRRRLRWVLWGLIVGFTPFVFLWVLPQVILSYGLVSEEVMLLASGIIPIAFGISIVKYHIMDIDLIVNRSMVYGSVMALLLIVYTVIVGSTAMLLTGTAAEVSLFVSGIAAVVVALLFEPARRRIQHVVDKRFFRVQYDFRLAERKFLEHIKHSMDTLQLAELVIREADVIFPVERIGFFLLAQPGNRLRVLAHRKFEPLDTRSIHFEPDKLKTRLDLPVALDDRIEQGVAHESADGRVFHRWGMAIVFPMLSGEKRLLGFLVLGEKKSGARFSSEDVDLLSNVATQAGREIERIALQRQLVLKETEAQKLIALDRMKSDFVSYVSHEFRTPLTSIRMFAELLKMRTGTGDRKSQEYLEIIEGESDRLNRMVTTILDSARIEQGVKQYVLRETDLAEIVRNVARTMKYQLDKQGFRFRFNPPKRKACIRADPDAVADALINIIANAIKYSAGRKYLRIRLQHEKEWYVCSVADHGMGISRGAIPHLFERFYRDPVHSDRVEGVGLGLPMVKHIMEAHGGKIEVRSVLGRGSTFSLCFPSAAMTG